MTDPGEVPPNKPADITAATAGEERALRDAGRKIVTWVAVIVSAAAIAVIIWVFTGNWVAVLLPAVFAIAPPLATVFKDQILRHPFDIKWPIIASCVALILVTNVITAASMKSLASNTGPGSPETAVMEPVETGADPNNTQCVKDAQIAASTNSNPTFQLTLLFSPTCHAAWAKISRRDNAGLGNQIDIALYRQDDPLGPDRQIAIEPDVNSAFTTLIVRKNPTDRLCAEGSVTAGQNKQTTNTICT